MSGSQECLVLGMGLNAFGQLGHHNQDGLTVGFLKKLMSLPSSPLATHFNSCWDALHVYCECDKDSVCITTGRWESKVKKAKLKLREDDEVVKVLEVNKSYILVQTKSQIFIVSESDVTQSKLPQNGQISVLANGTMYSLCSGKLHHCSISSDTNPPSLTLGPKVGIGVPINVASVACGGDHVLLLTKTGAVYSFGLNSRGQLGHGDISTKTQPTIIEALAGVPMKSVACGLWHSTALSTIGDVYSWGWGEHGQLGLGSEMAKTVGVPTLIEIDLELSFTAVSCGARHTMALTSFGDVYGWGWNGYGQLGAACPVGKQCPAPVKIELSYESQKVEALSLYCGHWNTIIVAQFCKEA